MRIDKGAHQHVDHRGLISSVDIPSLESTITIHASRYVCECFRRPKQPVNLQ